MCPFYIVHPPLSLTPPCRWHPPVDDLHLTPMTPFLSCTNVVHQKSGLVVDPPLLMTQFGDFWRPPVDGWQWQGGGEVNKYFLSFSFFQYFVDQKHVFFESSRINFGHHWWYCNHRSMPWEVNNEPCPHRDYIPDGELVWIGGWPQAWLKLAFNFPQCPSAPPPPAHGVPAMSIAGQTSALPRHYYFLG